MIRSLTLIFLLAFAGAMAQQSAPWQVPEGLRYATPLTDADARAMERIERITLPEGYRGGTLPDSVDNSGYIWFRPIFSQETFPNCMQSTSIAYNFTYEINRLRNLPASDSNNLYTTHFAWNFFNGGNGWYGVNYLFTMDVLRHHGTPNVADYGGFYYGGGQRWMSGYDEWYNAMGNRISNVYSIYVGDEDGLLTLKHWLNDHLDGSETGGVASFIACSPYNLNSLPPGSPHHGEKVMTAWCNEALHGMTIVGYNDSIRYDYNGDGQFTNDIDISGDGVVDMKDRETGALKFANSYGESFANDGFCYMMYKTLADDISEGGIWQNTVHVLDVKKAHTTRMTFKVSLEHNYRELLRVRTGISSDTASTYPEHIHDFTIFNFQGGGHYMQGNDTTPAHKTIEFGLDASPLLSYVEPGQPYKFFLLVDERDEDNLGTGQVNYFSLMDYSNGSLEIPCTEQQLPLVENGTTLLSVTHTPEFDRPVITTEQLPLYEPGEEIEMQMEAQGGQTPYTWSLDKNFRINITTEDFPATGGELLISNSIPDSLAVKQLDFSFPFYGNSYDSVIISSSGYLFFDENMFFWSYLVDMDYFLRNNRVIAPFFSSELFVSPDYESGLWYEGNNERATFRWKTTLRSQPGSGEANFAVILYPDGNIDFLYGEFDGIDRINGSVGVSDGDNMNYSLPDLPMHDEISPGTKIEFIAWELPSSLSITREGWLSVNQDDAGWIRDVGVLVIDNTLVKAGRIYQLTDGPEIKLEIEGDVIANGAETDFSLSLTNRGIAELMNVDVDLQCSHPHISLIDDHQLLPSIPPGQTVNVPLAFKCSSDVELRDRQNIVFDLSASIGQASYEKEFCMLSAAPSISLFDFRFMNQSGLLEPGSSANLEIRLLNAGSRASVQTKAYMYCNDPGISIEDPELDFGDIASGGINSVVVNLNADHGIYFGHEVDFNLEIEDRDGLTHEVEFNFRVGRVPVCVIDLDPYHYSGPNIHSLLQQMEVESVYTNGFPVSLLNYQSVIICLGVQFSYHEVSWQEHLKMMEYLNHGGNIYMESRVHWNLDDNYAIFDRFNIETEAFPGLYEILDGVDSTFTEGLAYRNLASQPFCYFRLKPVPPAFSILTGRAYPYCAAVAHDAGTYKTIGTLFELGTLIPSDSCELETYMQEVLDFFGIVKSSLDIEENSSRKTEDGIYSYPNPFSGTTSIPLHLYGNAMVQASVYDLQGRRICEIYPRGMMSKGMHKLSWDGRNDAGKTVPGGIYIFRIMLDQKPVSGKMVLMH